MRPFGTYHRPLDTHTLNFAFILLLYCAIEKYYPFFLPCNALYVIASENTGDPKRYFCTFGEKAHTSKRVSVIACDNAISKVQCATHLPEGNP